MRSMQPPPDPEDASLRRVGKAIVVTVISVAAVAVLAYVGLLVVIAVAMSQSNTNK